MRQRGFSLLEILVAFSILAIALGVLMQIFSSATRNADLAKDRGRALSLAQSLVAANSIGVLAENRLQGTTADGLSWNVSVTPFSDAAVDQQDQSGDIPRLALWKISAAVTWQGGSGNDMPVVRLVTLRARPRGSPS